MSVSNHLYILHLRYYREDISLGLFSSIEKAVGWINQYGLGWEEGENDNYEFVVISFVLDYENEHQPMDEIYVYDKYGNLKLEPTN